MRCDHASFAKARKGRTFPCALAQSKTERESLVLGLHDEVELTFKKTENGVASAPCTYICDLLQCVGRVSDLWRHLQMLSVSWFRIQVLDNLSAQRLGLLTVASSSRHPESH